MSGNLPVWVTISLFETTTVEEFCAHAARKGVRAEPTRDGRIQLPHGFLAWIENEPFPARLLDIGHAEGADKEDLEDSNACLHISGGTGELERQAHQTPEAVRRMTAGMRHDFAAISSLPGTTPRIISGAALKVERLTGVLRSLLDEDDVVVFPQAGNIAFPARQFQEMSAEYGSDNYHFPLYVFIKIRDDEEGPHATARGLFLFALPDTAIALKDGVPPNDLVRAMAAVQREMVAEGWWPEHGAVFKTEMGNVRLERVQDALFIVPLELGVDERRVAVARYRYALERCALQWFGQSTMYRERPPNLVVDHHLLPGGKSFAMTNGVSMSAQRGGTSADENERVEVLLFHEHLGPWATKWLAFVAFMIREGDGSHPIRPFDRLALQTPENGIAGVVAWPWGYFTPFGEAAGRVHLWCLIPILEEELAEFRSAPTAQRRWREERNARRDVETLFARWSRVAPARDDEEDEEEEDEGDEDEEEEAK